MRVFVCGCVWLAGCRFVCLFVCVYMHLYVFVRVGTCLYVFARVCRCLYVLVHLAREHLQHLQQRQQNPPKPQSTRSCSCGLSCVWMILHSSKCALPLFVILCGRSALEQVGVSGSECIGGSEHQESIVSGAQGHSVSFCIMLARFLTQLLSSSRVFASLANWWRWSRRSIQSLPGPESISAVLHLWANHQDHWTGGPESGRVYGIRLHHQGWHWTSPRQSWMIKIWKPQKWQSKRKWKLCASLRSWNLFATLMLKVCSLDANDLCCLPWWKQ